MLNSPAFLGYTALGAETTAKNTDLREVDIRAELLDLLLRILAIRFRHASQSVMVRRRPHMA